MGYLTKALGGALLIGYGIVLFGGFDFARHERSQIAPSLRQSPGGYRTWSFWHSGSGGGK